MNRRHFLSVLPLLICGCAHGLSGRPRGENASYAFFNPSHVNSFQMSRIDTATGFLNEEYDINALPPGSPGWSGGGPLHPADLGHRVPEFVWVSWRLMPRADQQRYQGDPVGPFKVKLRSLIPADVLDELGDPSLRRRLEVAVSVGVLPVRVRWQLVDTSKGKGLRLLLRGGDWRLPAPGE